LCSRSKGLRWSYAFLDDVHAKVDESQEYVVALVYVFNDAIGTSSNKWWYDKKNEDEFGHRNKGSVGILLQRNSSGAERVGLVAIQDIYPFVDEGNSDTGGKLVLPVTLEWIEVN
jgi:hypothetical protein